MKRIIVISSLVLVLVLLFTCGSPRVSEKGDPMAYFSESETWKVSDIEEEFGGFDSSEDVGSIYNPLIIYRKNKLPVFDNDWEFLVITEDSYGRKAVAGYFSFDQGKMSDKKLEKYFDRIFAYYSSEYGVSELKNSGGISYFQWETRRMDISLQCTNADGGDGISIAFAKK